MTGVHMKSDRAEPTDRAELFHWSNVSLAQVPRIIWRQRDAEEWKAFPHDGSVSKEGYVLAPGYRLIIELSHDEHLSIILDRTRK
jgi:hypothetical protein